MLGSFNVTACFEEDFWETGGVAGAILALMTVTLDDAENKQGVARVLEGVMEETAEEPIRLSVLKFKL